MIIFFITIIFTALTAPLLAEIPAKHQVNARSKLIKKLEHDQTTNEKSSLLRAITKNFRSQKNKPQFPYPGKFVKDLKEDELQSVLVYAKKVNDSELILKTFYFLMLNATDQENLKNYKLDLADYFFNNESWESAAIRYDEFFALYPGSKEAEYAQYKIVLCSFYLSLEPDRDQTKTEQTISLIQVFLTRAQNAQFIEEVTTIKKQCRQKLFKHEIHVFENYLQRTKLKSARKRLEYLQTHFNDIEHIEKYTSYCENMLKLVENIETRPFFLSFNIDDALTKKAEKITEPSKNMLRKLTSFFLA